MRLITAAALLAVTAVGATSTTTQDPSVIMMSPEFIIMRTLYFVGDAISSLSNDVELKNISNKIASYALSIHFDTGNVQNFLEFPFSLFLF